jgi:c-di-GMP-binding flagellar brake protein YcgR
MADEERRKAVRIKKVITVRYSYCVDKGDKKWDMTVVKDISETGMCVTTHKQFSAQEEVAFLIKIPSRPLDWMEFTGRVIASESPVAASGATVTGTYVTRIEFVNLKDEQKEAVREYITWFLSKEGGGKK